MIADIFRENAIAYKLQRLFRIEPIPISYDMIE